MNVFPIVDAFDLKMATETITTISPTTNQPVVTRPGLPSSEVEAMLQNAQTAFKSYRISHATLSSRQAIVGKALKLLSERQDPLAKELTEQMGRPIAYTPKEILTAVKRGEYLNKIAPDALEHDVPGEPEAGFKRYIRREPVGVVLIIFAWNYPYLILVNSLIPALLAGNAVILKPSPQTPTIVEHVAEIFTSAGLPHGVLQYFHSGSIDTITAAARHPLINHVCFTGSVAGGLALQRAVAGRIINIGLELGGKDPAYVRGDVDVKWAAEEIVDGAVFNSGQSCCAIERVYVATEIYNAFITAVQEVLAGYIVGDPFNPKTQIGPVISRRAKDAIIAQIRDAISQGARDETPSMVNSSGSLPSEGNFVAPVLLTHVNHEMSIMRDETFGPVVAVMPVSSDAEAIALMNDSQFGLTASIWTKDVGRGEELAALVEAGTVFVNRADFPSPDLAWTGWKDSGRGVTLSRFGFDQFVKLKSFHVKSYPAVNGV